jgi:aconitate hydratase
MFGLPVSLRLPEVTGVRLTNRLPAGALATDLALTITERLRQIDLAESFVEFHGPGVQTLSVGERAVVANMAPEYGASTGYFPIDSETLRYLVQTGRPHPHVALVQSYATSAGLWFDADRDPRYTRLIEIDLAAIEPSIAGPRRPQDRWRASRMRDALEEAHGAAPGRAASGGSLPQWPVAIAAITSCTNTTDPELLIAAGLVARKAVALGVRPPAWVKTSLAPGSPAAARFLERAGLSSALAAIGFDVVGYGCTTCIGNSGELTPEIRAFLEGGSTGAVAVLSGNRNFPGRVHPDLTDGFLASPPLVVAFALAGDADRDILADVIARTEDGRDITFADLWPSRAEIVAATALALRPGDFAEAFLAAEQSAEWAALSAANGPVFPWDESSTYIRRPPFVRRNSGSRITIRDAAPLIVVGDDITTDHISPAGQIRWDTAAGRHLISRGRAANDLNVFAAHRGNWEVMLRGLFTNKTVKNLLGDDLEPGTTVVSPGQQALGLADAAEHYRREGIQTVVFAGERYGMGSSRDWAAKGLALLGISAVCATSFERIHRSNLIGMGILPIRLPPDAHPRRLGLTPSDRISIAPVNRLAPGAAVEVRIRRGIDAEVVFTGQAAIQTELEVRILEAGGILPKILDDALEDRGRP